MKLADVEARFYELVTARDSVAATVAARGPELRHAVEEMVAGDARSAGDRAARDLRRHVLRPHPRRPPRRVREDGGGAWRGSVSRARRSTTSTPAGLTTRRCAKWARACRRFSPPGRPSRAGRGWPSWPDSSGRDSRWSTAPMPKRSRWKRSGRCRPSSSPRSACGSSPATRSSRSGSTSFRSGGRTIRGLRSWSRRRQHCSSGGTSSRCSTARSRARRPTGCAALEAGDLTFEELCAGLGRGRTDEAAAARAFELVGRWASDGLLRADSPA